MELRHNYAVVPTRIMTASDCETSFGYQLSADKDKPTDVTSSMSLKQSVREFSFRTTFHGMRYIFEEGRLARRSVCKF